MRYDFDQVVDRSGNLSAKYDERVKKFGTEDVIPLWIADMDFKTAQPIIDALRRRAEEGIWGYTARPGSYFEAVRDWQSRRNGWAPEPGLMSFCLGVVQTLSACVQLYTPQGGSVLIQTPVYGEFYDMTEFAGRRVIENQLTERDGRWTVDWEDFEAKLREADLFLLCSPHNPLGLVWTEEELRRMMELCLKHRVLVVSDEIHSDLIFHGKKHIPTASLSPEIAANVITGISATKTFIPFKHHTYICKGEHYHESYCDRKPPLPGYPVRPEPPQRGECGDRLQEPLRQPAGPEGLSGSASGQPRLCRYPGERRNWDSLLCPGGRHGHPGFGSGLEVR